MKESQANSGTGKQAAFLRVVRDGLNVCQNFQYPGSSAYSDFRNAHRNVVPNFHWGDSHLQPFSFQIDFKQLSEYALAFRDANKNE